MKKKQITLLTCSVIAVTLASVYLTNKETNVNESDNLLALNIEALSFGDENGEIEGVSECSGPPDFITFVRHHIAQNENQ